MSNKTTRTVAAGNGLEGYRRIEATAYLSGYVRAPELKLWHVDGVPMSPAEARKLADKLNELADLAEQNGSTDEAD